MHRSADERPRMRSGYTRPSGRLSVPSLREQDTKDSADTTGGDSASERIVPDRLLYLKRVAEHERVIEICTGKLDADACNTRTLKIRASALSKTGAIIIICIVLAP